MPYGIRLGLGFASGQSQGGAPVAATIPWRPSDDDAQYAIYNPGTSGNIDDSSGAVNTLRDETLNQIPVTASTTNRPQTGVRSLNGLNVLDFDGNENLAQGSATLPASGDVAFIWIGEIDAVTASAESAFSFDAANDFQMQAGNGSQFDAELTTANLHSGGTIAATGGPYSGATIIIAVFDWTNSTIKIRINGEEVGSGSYDVQISSSGNLRWMANRNGGVELDGSLAFGALTEDLTTDNLEKWEGYLAHRFDQATLLPSGHSYKDAAPTIAFTDPGLPASVAGAWSPKELTSLSGVTKLTDITGNGRHIFLGTTAPALATDSVSGLKNLTFTASTSSRLEDPNFFDDVGVTASDDYAMLCVFRINSSSSASSGQIMGDDGSSPRARLMREIGGTLQNVEVGETNQSLAEDDGYSAALSGPDHRLEVTQKVGGTAEIYGFTSDPCYSQDIFGRTDDRETVSRSSTVTPVRGLIINDAQHGMEFYGAMYLHDPTQEDIDEAVGWALREWVAGDSRTKAFLFQGDSLTNASIVGRGPGYPELLGDTLEASAMMYSFARGSRRAITGTGSGNNIADGDVFSVYQRYAKAWSDALPGNTYAPLMIGQNDLNIDSATTSAVIAGAESWAASMASVGARPIWMSTGFTFSTSGTTTVSEGVRDNQEAGSNDFVDTMDLLEFDANFQWGRDNAAAVPSLFDDAIHPNAAGNADAAPKMLPFFTAL